MAITVTGTNPTFITVVSATVTTDTLGANPPNDRSYAIADDVVGIINPSVAVGGFGLEIQTLGVGRDLTFTNNGFINIDQASEALWLTGLGRITYAGSGTLTNGGSGTALTIQTTRDAAEVTVGGDLTASSGIAANIVARDGITFTQSAGTVISNSIGNNVDAVFLTIGTGPLVATLDGTIIAGRNAMTALSSGDITVDLTGTLFANDGEGIDTVTPGVTTITSAGNIDAPGGIGIRAVSQGAGLTTVNLTAGHINGLQGIDFVAQGNGGLVVDMTGGRIGSATQRTLDRGLSAELSGTGAIDITVSNASGIWSELSSAIVAFIGNAASTADVTVVVDGTLDSLNSNGVSGTAGAGDVHVTNNGTITAGNLGLDLATVSGTVHVFNAGTITGTGGEAITFFNGGGDTLTLAPTSVINGIVDSSGGGDALQLGGTTGTGTFDVSDIGGAQQYRNFDTFNVIGATWILTGTGTDAWTVSGGTLGGTATIGDLAVTGGTVAPGASAGILSTGNFGFGAVATLAMEIGGATPGTGHDQLAVTGAVVLAGRLEPSLINGFSPVPGTSFVIIANDGVDPVLGTFAGLAEGALFTAGGSSWRITYAGGDGNDVALTALEPPPNDFNGDFHSDILWRNDAGTLRLWTMDGAAVLSNVAVNPSAGPVPTELHIEDADGDFNGDGDSDILLRDDAGTVVLWETAGADTVIDTIPTHWHIEDTGDLNGDGRRDILWHDDAGALVLWEMDGPNVIGNTFIANAATSEVEEVADFTGDGRSDILLRDQDGTVRLWEMDGATIVADTVIAVLPDYWQVAATGDFNGDFRADILWRDDAGTVVMWEMDGANIIGNTALGTLPDYWQIADAGDYNGDFRADILWRDDAGTIVLWEMDGPTIVDNTAVNTIPTSWQIVG